MSKRMSESENRITELLRAEKADSFAPYFSDRVMKRLAAPSSEIEGSMYDSLRWVFLRAAVACIVLIAIAGAFNLLDVGVTGAATWVDALFGLPSDALADALTYDLI